MFQVEFQQVPKFEQRWDEITAVNVELQGAIDVAGCTIKMGVSEATFYLLAEPRERNFIGGALRDEAGVFDRGGKDVKPFWDQGLICKPKIDTDGFDPGSG